MSLTSISKNIWQTQSRLSAQSNHLIFKQFENHWQDENIRRTHLFDGRYENIYLNEQHIPDLALLINEATQLAEKVLNIKNLRAGYWFNYMPPGATTTLHTHDDDDELLSGVYYVKVPENSGNLIIYDDSDKQHPKKIEITPKAGEFVFFKPDVRHEVSRNNSTEHRLSIGINFGVVKD